MASKTFPLTLTTTDGRTWLRDASYLEVPGIRNNYVLYHTDGDAAYSKGGQALYAIRYVDTETEEGEVIVCQPGRKIAEIA